MDLSSIDLRQVVTYLIILVLSIAVHEFGHAFVADRLGDRLPRMQGRVTLNPLAHADPIGTLALPAFALLVGGIGFGWGRPVQINPTAFDRRMTMRTGHMLVAAAGPAMNILFGFVLSFVLLFLWKSGIDSAASLELFQGVAYAILINFVLAFFNLVPAAPLDGGAVLAGLLPRSLLPGYEKIQQYGFFILIAVLVIPQLQAIFVVPARFLFRTWVGGVLGIPV